MTVYTMQVGGAGVALRTPLDIGSVYASWLKSDAPPIFELKADPLPVRYALHHVDDAARSICFLPGVGSLCLNWPSKELGEGDSLLHLGYILLERQLGEMGAVTAHAACVSVNGRGILLMGKSGAGKTSTALAICRRAGAHLVGNDLVVIRKDLALTHALEAVTGTRFFTLREASIKQTLPDLAIYFTQGVSMDPWLNKVVVRPESLGIKIEDRPVPIVAVMFVHVDPTQVNGYELVADSLANRLYVYENFSRFIRNCVSPLMVGGALRYGAIVPCLDDASLHADRLSLMESVFSDCQARYASGSLNFIVDCALRLALE